MTILLLRTEQNGTKRNENGTIGKKEREQNDLAEGPCSRTERNNFKKVETCPALVIALANSCIFKSKTKIFIRLKILRKKYNSWIKYVTMLNLDIFPS